MPTDYVYQLVQTIICKIDAEGKIKVPEAKIETLIKQWHPKDEDFGERLLRGIEPHDCVLPNKTREVAKFGGGYAEYFYELRRCLYPTQPNSRWEYVGSIRPNSFDEISLPMMDEAVYLEEWEDELEEEEGNLSAEPDDSQEDPWWDGEEQEEDE